MILKQRTAVTTEHFGSGQNKNKKPARSQVSADVDFTTEPVEQHFVHSQEWTGDFGHQSVQCHNGKIAADPSVTWHRN